MHLSNYLFSSSFLDAARISSKHFIRQRTLTVPTVVSFPRSGVQGAVQSELDQFFSHLRDRANSVRAVTAQAFYQAPYRINALVFGELNEELIRLVEEHLPIPRWRGLRLVA